MGFLSKLLTAKKETKRLSKIADEVLSLEEDMAILTDEEIKNKTKQFQQEVQEIEDVKTK